MSIMDNLIPKPGGGGSSNRPRSSGAPVFTGGGASQQGGDGMSPPVGGYSVQAVAPGTSVMRNPTIVFQPYRDDDVTNMLNGIVRSGSIYDLQLALIQAGFLSDDAVLGYIDSQTQSAFEDLLAVANQHGMRWEDVLSQAADGGGVTGSAGGGGGGLAPGLLALPNRDDLLARVDDLAMSTLGQKIDEDLQEAITDSVIDSYRTQQERQVQKELSASGDYVTVEEPPTTDRMVEDELRKRRPGMVMEQGVRDAMDAWFAALQGPVA